jgi:hypothetical protein
MTSIDNDIASLREAIDEASAHDLRELAKELCDKAEGLERSNDKDNDRMDELEEELRELKGRGDSVRLMRHRYPGLFFGDLNKLNDCDRQDMFEAVAKLSFTDRSDSDAERTLARFDGMIR